ncbi:hypothetical protein FOZ60_011589 [Perkinsus olseni]|uniref:Uncharacterized protein n=1 Tax=Perkinsus olseni TaxID=32597 RepID=A0A7J6ND06_PEROL|nr:hypothetical protein FOZ60_011589 [Perkinsus olseni]
MKYFERRGLLVPALRALSSREALERISTDDLINCLLGTGIARSFEVAPEVLGVFLKTAAERLGTTDKALNLDDRAKIYRAACRNILVDNEDAARARESVAANFDDGKVLAQLPLAICMSDVLSPALHSQVEDPGRRERIAVACVRDILNPMTRDDWFLLSLDELTIVAKACFDAAMASVPGWLREEGMPAYLGVLLAIGRTRREEVAHRGMGYVNLRGAPVYDLSAFVRLMSATRIFHYKALGTIADVICDAPLEDISLKVCFRTLRASSSLRWYEQELFAKISAAVLARLTESGGIFSDDRPDTRLLHLAPAIYHLALSAHISAELASAIMEEFQDTARVSKRLQQWAALLTTEGGGDERSAMRRLVGASTQMVWAAAAMRFISEEGMLPATIIKTVFEMLVDLADSEGMSSQKLGSLAAINDMYKFSSDLTFALREAELRREGPLRSRATEWLRGKLGASGASFTEAFADNELTGGYTVDIVIGDPSNKHGVLVAPRNACYRSHLDGRRDRAPMATQLNVAALKKLGWKVGIIYEAILEPAKSTQNLSDDAGMTSELRKAGVLPTEE